MRLLGILVLTALLSFVGYCYYISQPLFDSTLENQPKFKIAQRSDALTFARTKDSLILVLDHHGNSIRGINLTELYGTEETSDLIDLYHSMGYQVLSELDAVTSDTDLTSLALPYNYVAPHLAVGTNYSEHAEEVYLDAPPFLFPKLAKATRWIANINFTDRLDYEAELCLVPLEDIDSATELPEFGMLLCNDFSDRYTLIKQIKLNQPMGTTGFADAKGKPSFLPTGYLFVIPKQSDFYLDVRLQLHLNKQTRQDYSSADMILKIEGVLKQVFAHKETPFYTSESTISLLPSGKIKKGSIILTGTAAGVMFKPINIWNPNFYLQLGDEVVTRATYLGHLENKIMSK